MRICVVQESIIWVLSTILKKYVHFGDWCLKKSIFLKVSLIVIYMHLDNFNMWNICTELYWMPCLWTLHSLKFENRPKICISFELYKMSRGFFFIYHLYVLVSQSIVLHVYIPTHYPGNFLSCNLCGSNITDTEKKWRPGS